MATTQKKRSQLWTKAWSIAQGDFLEKWFSTGVLRWMIALVFLGIAMVYNQYSAMRKLKEIDRLKRQLNELRLEQVSITSTLMGASRISAIEDRVKEEHLNIAIPKTPPIIVD